MSKMKYPLAPGDIAVLLHCYLDTVEHPRFDSPMVRASVDMFTQCGMIAPRDGAPRVYRTTPKGDAFVEGLRRVPEPVPTWVVEMVP